MKCFYHSADLDGHCSGAIVKYRFPDCEMFPINYGKEFPWDKLTDKHEKVFMVDFTLQPFDQMEKLNNLCHLIWIDHHKTELEEAEKRKFDPIGSRKLGIGACVLTWKLLYDTSVPESVQLLGEYDVWNFSDPRTLAFQYGFRLNGDTFPNNQELWKDAFTGSVDKVLDKGRLILSYEESQNTKFARAYSFETLFCCGGQEFFAICANKGFTNSKVFDSVYNPEKHHLMITFARLKLPARKWTVSLYSTRDDIDCGQIARQFGGGGHKGAAGFQCEDLPFAY